MFVTDGPTNYDRVFNDLLALFRKETTPKRGTEVFFFQDPCVVTEDGIYAASRRIDNIGGILILRYLLGTSDDVTTNRWVPYREFRDGSNFASYIKSRIEDAVAREFTGRKEILINKLETLGGRPYPFEAKPDIAMVVRAFPTIPILSTFWDADDEFPSSFQFLLDRSAPSFLDMESLAVLLHYTHQKMITP